MEKWRLRSYIFDASEKNTVEESRARDKRMRASSPPSKSYKRKHRPFGAILPRTVKNPSTSKTVDRCTPNSGTYFTFLIYMPFHLHDTKVMIFATAQRPPVLCGPQECDPAALDFDRLDQTGTRKATSVLAT